MSIQPAINSSGLNSYEMKALALRKVNYKFDQEINLSRFY